MRREDFDYTVLLESRAKQFNVLPIFKSLLLRHPKFKTWPASHHPSLHHYEENGLVRHTAEVVELGLQTIPILHIEVVTDPVEYYLAALFHDTGKMYDYDMFGDQKNELGELVNPRWEPTEHRRMIHHIPESMIIFHDIVQEHAVSKDMHDAVVHAILAHHGSREFGSPVAPKSRVAWLLHLCDGLSARMDDCDRIDVLKKASI